MSRLRLKINGLHRMMWKQKYPFSRQKVWVAFSAAQVIFPRTRGKACPWLYGGSGLPSSLLVPYTHADNTQLSITQRRKSTPTVPLEIKVHYRCVYFYICIYVYICRWTCHWAKGCSLGTVTSSWPSYQLWNHRLSFPCPLCHPLDHQGSPCCTAQHAMGSSHSTA